MQVITRDVGESFLIGDNLRVTILLISGSSIHIGIEAPEYIDIQKKEVYRYTASEKENKASGLLFSNKEDSFY